jgi:hypothetical protein
VSGWYVYGIVDAGSGLAETGIELVRHGDVAAVVGRVDLDEYDEEALPDRLADGMWLAGKVLAHEDVLRRVAAQTTVLPIRFGAVYAERDDVARLLEDGAADYRAALARVRGCVEMGVKAWADRAELDARVEAGAAPDEQSLGRQYLLRRQRERTRAAEAAARMSEIAHDAHRRLADRAVDAVANPPQPRELTDRSEQMLLNGAYLVRRDDEGLAAEVAALDSDYGELGVTFELTGPWPPHNFVEAGAAEE